MTESDQDPGVKQFVKNFLLVFFGLLIIAGIISSGNFFGPKPEEISTSKLVQEVQAGEVKKLTVRGSRIEIILHKEDKEQVVQKEPGESAVELLTRYGVTSEQLTILNQNLSAANSRIKDVDVADESTEFAKQNILVQSGTAMLAQANAVPIAALQLLG